MLLTQREEELNKIVDYRIIIELRADISTGEGEHLYLEIESCRCYYNNEDEIEIIDTQGTAVLKVPDLKYITYVHSKLRFMFISI